MRTVLGFMRNSGCIRRALPSVAISTIMIHCCEGTIQGHYDIKTLKNYLRGTESALQFDRKKIHTWLGKIRKNFRKEEGNLWVACSKMSRRPPFRERKKAFLEKKIKTKVAACC